jgi:HNH endonuclease
MAMSKASTAFQKVKAKYGKVKPKKLRKRSKSKATIDKADRALQDWYRWYFAGEKCENCGAGFQVMHHHIEKSKSNAGRYFHDNLVHLCHHCHSLITFQDHSVVANYSTRRGPEWVAQMNELKKKRRGSYGKKELEGIIKLYEIPK